MACWTPRAIGQRLLANWSVRTVSSPPVSTLPFALTATAGPVLKVPDGNGPRSRPVHSRVSRGGERDLVVGPAPEHEHMSIEGRLVGIVTLDGRTGSKLTLQVTCRA